MPLSARALAGLKAYQYVATGYTWLDDAHQPAWNCVCGACGHHAAFTTTCQIHAQVTNRMHGKRWHPHCRASDVPADVAGA
jgi:hypothetical protein